MKKRSHIVLVPKTIWSCGILCRGHTATISNAIEEFSMSQVGKEILDELLALTRESYVMLEKLIEVGIQSGEFREDNTRDLMYIVNGLLSGLGVLYYELDYKELKRIYKRR